MTALNHFAFSAADSSVILTYYVLSILLLRSQSSLIDGNRLASIVVETESSVHPLCREGPKK
jgi:hypothetical protein